MINLKRCPFCGSSDIRIETFQVDGTEKTMQHVVCSQCRSGVHHNRRLEAVRLWNEAKGPYRVGGEE